MPIWLRTVTFNMIKTHYDKQNEDAQSQQSTMENKGKINRPNIPVPTYTTKTAAKK